MAEIIYEVVKQLGTLSDKNNGWCKEINLVSWNNREPVYDIRTWTTDHERMGKGVTLTAEELAALRDLLNEMTL